MENSRKCKLVLGNGFDLYCGLDTKYNDFFNSQEKTMYNNYEKNKYVVLRENNQQKIQLGTQISKYEFNTYNYDDAEQKALVVKYYGKDTTFWDLLFYYDPTRESFKKWCDIESCIYNFFNKKIGNNKSQFENMFHIIATKENDHIIQEEHLFPIAYCILKEYGKKSKKEFASELLEELKKFEHRFGKYVNLEFESKLHGVFLEKLGPFINDIELREKIVSIDSFNYTSLAKANSPKFKYDYNIIYHINGDYNNPIFGIDSSDFSSNNDSYIFTKTVRRMNNNFYNFDSLNYYLDKPFDDLIIFGHSLNKQDYNYYFPIFDYMGILDSNSNKSIIIYYTVYGSKTREQIFSEKIESFTKMLQEYEQYKTGKKENYRLVDSLAAQGRIAFRKI